MSTSRIASPLTGTAAAPASSNPFAEAAPLRADAASGSGSLSFADLLSRQAGGQIARQMAQQAAQRVAQQAPRPATQALRAADAAARAGSPQATPAAQDAAQSARPRDGTRTEAQRAEGAKAPRNNGNRAERPADGGHKTTDDGEAQTATASHDASNDTSGEVDPSRAAEAQALQALGDWLASHGAHRAPSADAGDTAGGASARGGAGGVGAAEAGAVPGLQTEVALAAGQVAAGREGTGADARAAGLLARPSTGDDRAGAAAQTAATGLDAVRMLDADAQASLGGAGSQAEAGAGRFDAVLQAAVQAAGPVAGAAAGGAAGRAEAGAVSGHVAAEVGSPGFANELGEQVRVMIHGAGLRDGGGLHEARLSLNPAELGPVTIRIAMDGQQAQVEFAAASETTRRAIEDSLPALAGALQSEGLTLAGGGVYDQQSPSQQPGQQAFDGAASGSGREHWMRAPSPARGDERADGLGATAGLPPGTRSTSGVVDLYA